MVLSSFGTTVNITIQFNQHLLHINKKEHHFIATVTNSWGHKTQAGLKQSKTKPALLKINEVLKKDVNMHRNSYMGYMPNPAATNFPTAATAAKLRGLNLFDLNTAEHLPRGCRAQ